MGCVRFCASARMRVVERTPRGPINKTSEGAESHTGIYRAEPSQRSAKICILVIFQGKKYSPSGTWRPRSFPFSSSPWSGAEWASPCPGWCPTDPIKGDIFSSQRQNLVFSDQSAVFLHAKIVKLLSQKSQNYIYLRKICEYFKIR